jgi:hypothetical protein
LRDSDKSGIYLIGRFTQPPPSGTADPFDNSVVYIGESSRERFRGRWRSFERAAFKGTGKHRGGKRYKEKFGGDSSVLYISILTDEGIIKAFLGLEKYSFIEHITDDIKVTDTVELDVLLHEIDDLLIKYVERRLILLYSLIHGNRPACNAD